MSKAEDPWAYKTLEWLAVWRAARGRIDREPPNVQMLRPMPSRVRMALEIEARRFFDNKSPDEERKEFNEYMSEWKKMRKYAWNIVNLYADPTSYSQDRRKTIERKFYTQLQRCGYSRDLEFDEGVSLATQDGRESFAWFCEQQIEHSRGAWCPPERTEDPKRKLYLFGLCRIWRDGLLRSVGRSWTAKNEASGPMVSFLTSAANPMLSRARRPPLTESGARNLIEDFIDQHSGKTRRRAEKKAAADRAVQFSKIEAWRQAADFGCSDEPASLSER